MSKEPLSDMPAFPVTREMRGSWAASGGAGMTMRQYYKAATLQGLLAAGKDHNFDYTGDTSLAVQCGNLADAMLAEDEEHAKK